MHILNLVDTNRCAIKLQKLLINKYNNKDYNKHSVWFPVKYKQFKTLLWTSSAAAFHIVSICTLADEIVLNIQTKKSQKSSGLYAWPFINTRWRFVCVLLNKECYYAFKALNFTRFLVSQSSMIARFLLSAADTFHLLNFNSVCDASSLNYKTGVEFAFVCKTMGEIVCCEQ